MNELTQENMIEKSIDFPIEEIFKFNKLVDSKEKLKFIRKIENWIESHVRHGKSAIKYTQLRGIYQLIMENESDLIQALPRIVYKEASQDYQEQKDFVYVIRLAMEMAIENDDPLPFIEFIKSVVAYYKYYSTK